MLVTHILRGLYSPAPAAMATITELDKALRYVKSASIQLRGAR